MKLAAMIIGTVSTYFVLAAQTVEDVILPAATLIGLLGLIIKYVRDYKFESELHEHYERIIEHQREYYESTITSLRLELKLCQENRKK